MVTSCVLCLTHLGSHISEGAFLLRILECKHTTTNTLSTHVFEPYSSYIACHITFRSGTNIDQFNRDLSFSYSDCGLPRLQYWRTFFQARVDGISPTDGHFT